MLEIAWIIPLFPFAACAVLIFFGAALKRRIGEAVGWIAVAGIAATLPFSIGALTEILCGRTAYSASIPWAVIAGRALEVGYQVDPLTAVMLAMVSVVATCIMVYSTGYMHGDDGYQRFFAYMSLFCGSMFLLVLANNFLVLYVAWELVGLCSYLLIGFWFERPAAARAAVTAFITT
ncbi:MAG: NADH-quinone oxidoreductase subunit L, partial [Armatimonadetes bacterium]|nr:NADH-quinone oxidoreductase subunit L [Armatimonadota bacterium]